VNELFPAKGPDDALWQQIHSYARPFPQFIHALQMLFRRRKFKARAIA